MTKVVILGAGLTGLSCSFHLGHEKCIIFEKNNYSGGHIYSYKKYGAVWDEGPHVSFTKNKYVKSLFKKSVNGQFIENSVSVSNFYKGAWIPHPAQSNLYAIPEPLRTLCFNDFIQSREIKKLKTEPKNYEEWLYYAFGKTFSTNFPSIYTKKYWTCEPRELSVDWIGNRVFYPDVDTVKKGYTKYALKNNHYINSIRYPLNGGYLSFAKGISNGANIEFGHKVSYIDLQKKELGFTNGEVQEFVKLINTLPLNEFINLTLNVPKKVIEASKALNCSSLLLVNVTAEKANRKPYHWMYVYDEEKLSTRINQIDLLSPNNTSSNDIGVQVEVYSSRFKPLNLSFDEIANKVIQELKIMEIIDKPKTIHYKFVPYANIIFDHDRKEAQNIILSWLENFGLKREEDDLEPMTNWSKENNYNSGTISLAGRYGQWKYFWTDDCILRGAFISNKNIYG